MVQDDISNLAQSNEAEGRDIAIPDFEIEALARCLLPKLQAYFDSPEGQAEFEAWKQRNTDT